MIQVASLVMSSKAVPYVVTALGCTAVAVARKRRKISGMTPERAQIYEAALISLKDGSRLRHLASVFESEGLVTQAKLLRQRADLNDAPPEKKLERRELYRKAMQSKNPKAVLSMAAAFDEVGATGAAFNLRQYAAALIQLGPNRSAPPPPQVFMPAPTPAMAGEDSNGENGENSDSNGD